MAKITKSLKEVCVQRRIERLCAAIVREAVNKGYADLWDESWNPDAHAELTLTIKEIRLAAEVVAYRPTKLQLARSRKAREWAEYIDELDGVE